MIVNIDKKIAKVLNIMIARKMITSKNLSDASGIGLERVEGLRSGKPMLASELCVICKLFNLPIQTFLDEVENTSIDEGGELG